MLLVVKGRGKGEMGGLLLYRHKLVVIHTRCLVQKLRDQQSPKAEESSTLTPSPRRPRLQPMETWHEETC